MNQIHKTINTHHACNETIKTINTHHACNETIKTIYARHTCRAYTGELPPDDKLQVIAQAALAAPSAMNRQPWRVIVVKDRALITELESEGLARIQAEPDQTTWERLKSRGGTLFYNAPCLLVIASDNAPADCGILAQTAALAATSLGVDNCICGLAGAAFGGERGDEFKQRLGFPAGYQHGLTLLLGYGKEAGQGHELDHAKLLWR